MMPEPFTDSRRLTGCNVYFAGTGAALEAARGLAFDDGTLARWQAHIAAARAALGWPETDTVIRRHPSGASLAFTAPLDQLYTATEVNEWAWWSALVDFRTDPADLTGASTRAEAVAVPFSPREKVAEEPAPYLIRGRMREGAQSSNATSRKKLPFDQETQHFIRQLRKNSTDPEQLLWSFLRDRRLHGQKFRRQKTLGPYILDFYCHELKLAIALDGGQHNEPQHLANDAKRDAFVASQGVMTLRYWNHEVLGRTEDVLFDISHRVLALVKGDAVDGESMPSSAPVSSTGQALRAPSPKGRREEQKLFHAPGHAAVWDADSALVTLRLAAVAEARPALTALQGAAAEHRVAFLADDDEVSLGEGSGSRCWFVDELPAPALVPWRDLHDMPTALVTGSNGKTTTVRLLAAMTRAHGWRTAHTCTDGVYFEGQSLEAGDFSGPTGARTALRHPQAQAAILETARGGMLRRGLAVCRANVAVVTNIAVDHFGEYGVHTLLDLARVKLTVARAIGPGGLLVLNADDAVLREQAQTLSCPLGWFALDFENPLLQAHRSRGGPVCGVRDGTLWLQTGDASFPLGEVASMPITLDGRASYNIANLAGAALAGSALGVPPATLADTLLRFGRSPADNPGRLQRWRFGDLQVYVDYAHNPDGLRGLLRAIDAQARRGRLAMILGHAGNREDADLRAVASAAAQAGPDLVVLKDIAGYERGRSPGEVAAIMRAQLVADGVAETAIATCLDEVDAARLPLAWARDGDLLVLPIHEMEAREQVTALLDRMAAQGWRAGEPLPDADADTVGAT
jgi:UDP-N-acetylmuramyl tripeptide synthase/very-short-patch-repair endonuclease